MAIDGKSLNGAYEKGEKSSPRMMVSAYAAGLRLTLAKVVPQRCPLDGPQKRRDSTSLHCRSA
jgi:hypothetical protein